MRCTELVEVEKICILTKINTTIQHLSRFFIHNQEIKKC